MTQRTLKSRLLFGAKRSVPRSLLSAPSLKTINKSNICTNNSFIYINISFILINISFIYTFLRSGAKYLTRWRLVFTGNVYGLSLRVYGLSLRVYGLSLRVDRRDGNDIGNDNGDNNACVGADLCVCLKELSVWHCVKMHSSNHFVILSKAKNLWKAFCRCWDPSSLRSSGWQWQALLGTRKGCTLRENNGGDDGTGTG